MKRRWFIILPPYHSIILFMSFLFISFIYSFIRSSMHSFKKQPPEVFYRKKMFLKISQNLQETTCARVTFLTKLQAYSRPATLLKKGLWHRCFPVNFAKFLRALFHRTPRDCFCHSFLDPLIVDELILQHGRPMKGVKSYIPLGLLSKALTIANLPNAQAELRLCWMNFAVVITTTPRRRLSVFINHYLFINHYPLLSYVIII